MILFLIGLFIYILITNDICLKKVFIILLGILLLKHIYECMFNKIVENEDLTTPLKNIITNPNNDKPNILKPDLTNYKKALYELLSSKVEVLQNRDIFEYINIGPGENIKNHFYIKIKPLNFMFGFIHILDSPGIFTIKFKQLFKDVLGTQITHTFNTGINDGWSSTTNFGARVIEVNNDNIKLDTAVNTGDKSSCYVMVYGLY